MLAMLALPTTRSLSPDGMIAGSPDPGGTQDTAPIPQPGAGARPLPPAYDSIPSLDADAATVGLAPVGAPFFGSLAADTSYEHEVFLEQGPHTIAASCDAGCDDIDLTLIDRGVTIAEDTEYNDTPAVTTTVPARGTYQLRVHMITCARPACGYRVQVYRRP